MKKNIKQIKIDSPLEHLRIGDMMDYSGIYINGPEFGESPIKEFFYEVVVDDNGNEVNIKDMYVPVYAKLENNKLQLLGFFKNGKFIKRYSL